MKQVIGEKLNILYIDYGVDNNTMLQCLDFDYTSEILLK